MELKGNLRKHFKKNNDNVWVPKLGFDTEEEIKEKLGFNPKECILYKCPVCNKLHSATYEAKI